MGHRLPIATFHTRTARIHSCLAVFQLGPNKIGLRWIRRPHYFVGSALRIELIDVFFRLFRKSAHNNAITQVELATLIFQGKPTNVVLSTGKDGFFKIWDAETRLCLSVIATGAT